MKRTILFFALLSTSFYCLAQKKSIEKQFNQKEAISHFRFLASDELMGRDPARPEMDAASRYIAEQFWKYGAKEVPGAKGYYQEIPFRLSAPPTKGTIMFGEESFNQGTDLLVLDGDGLEGTYELVVLQHGVEADYQGVDVKGKIIVANIGAPNRMNPADLFSLGREKIALAKSNGAVAIIEMFNVPTVPWPAVVNYLGRPQLTIGAPDSKDALPYIWARDLKNELINAIGRGEIKNAKVDIQGKKNRNIIGKNVIAYIEGTDPVLKNEYVMLSAHYDHVGVGRPDAKGDSIYNGARDNAVGTVAVINAAKYFAENPPKRSILLCAWTAEEKGLLGSEYFANNPLIPLKQIIYNLNIDNGGYNDTNLVTVIGLGRTSADPLIEKAVSEFGLKAIADPAPEQGLYDRSDNVNFARRGIPAPTFSLGFTAFDDEISKYYHQPGDHVDNFDLEYAVKYWKSYILSAQYIANWNQKPVWQSGDKYETAGKELYGLK
ncbi:M28 family peptidase [Mariniradius sediminis]|uniref:M28 family peptidase n=1 Tax=Mariniradius sediminis TaxID=2909237 RepID=A0ABS9BYY5_9BACT|nr:M28 family peptidase [Mariniradius sediminis]MCF1752509.1 M28 family peptidase [Mariniradius sediminis]